MALVSKPFVTRLRSLSSRKNGFRLSFSDVVAIAICAATTALFHDSLGQLVWLFPITLGHFFLFCNVFRVCRRLESIWAVIFVANVAMFTMLDRIEWAPILAMQFPATVAVIVTEIRSSRYHGIFSSDEVGAEPAIASGQPISTKHDGLADAP